MLMFDLDAEGAFGQGLADELGLADFELAPHERREFEDGEFKLRPLADPRGHDAYVVYSLHGGPRDSPHDKLFALLAFIATLRDHGAARVTAVVPYLAYGRKDRRTQPFDSVTLRYVAQLFEAVGTAQLIVLEAHNPAALENAFRCPVVQVQAHQAFDAVAEPFRGTLLAVASPDPGGVKRAQLWREHLASQGHRDVGFAIVDKRRSGGVLSGLDAVAGDVQGATVLLIDDLIATGHTLVRAAHALRAAGAARVIACAAHGLFVEGAEAALADPAVERIVVCDGVPPFRVAPGGELAAKLDMVSCLPLFAQIVREQLKHEPPPTRPAQP